MKMKIVKDNNPIMRKRSLDVELPLSTEDKKHPLRFEEYEAKLLKSLPYKNRKYAELMLSNIYDDFLDFCNYYNEKYYRAGFGDCLNLVIMSLGGNNK